MSAGQGSALARARKLDRLMVQTFGPDYREKVVRYPTGSFRLADCFAEAGLQDPRAAREDSTVGYGLWQITPHAWER